MRLCILVLLTVLFVTTLSCALHTRYPGGVTFENPFCQEVELTFVESGSRWVAEETVSNIISEDYELETIQIIDFSSLPLDYIKLAAPPDDDGKSCPFFYPSKQGMIWYSGNTFEKSTSGRTTIFTADNTTQRFRDSFSGTTLYCPPDKTLGNWTLRLKCPLSYASSSFRATVTVCFEYEE